jgi:hypothetical protein
MAALENGKGTEVNVGFQPFNFCVRGTYFALIRCNDGVDPPTGRIVT